jgi:thimet oligopeptidase
MPTETTSASSTQDLHVWEAGGAASAEALTAWVSARLAAHESALAALLAVAGARTPENSLRHFDAAIEQLSLAGAQAGILNSVAADKAVRDQAQMEAQRVAMAGSALSLNRAVYDALVAISLDGASAATKHYVGRTLLGYRLSGVDKDEATRDRLHALHDKATQLSLAFSRNIQEGGKTVEAAPEELEGLPADYIARHPAQKGKSGAERVTLTTDPPDMMPVMTFAASAELRKKMFLAYNTRAYPANRQLLLDLLATRQEIASVLGFRSWADLATADQMMESAANVRTFLAKLDEASREGARDEHAQVLAFARDRQPELSEIDITSRGYWYEQFRRTKYDFDSQSVRPYFPYARVEAGVGEIGDSDETFQSRVPAIHCAGVARGGFGVRGLRGRAACGTVLSRHASARRQEQVVLGHAGSCGRARARPAGGGTNLQFPCPGRNRSGITAVLRRGDIFP